MLLPAALVLHLGVDAGFPLPQCIVSDQHASVETEGRARGHLYKAANSRWMKMRFRQAADTTLRRARGWAGPGVGQGLDTANGFPWEMESRLSPEGAQADLSEQQWGPVGRDSLPAACGEMEPSSCQMHARFWRAARTFVPQESVLPVSCGPGAAPLENAPQQGKAAAGNPNTREAAHRVSV